MKNFITITFLVIFLAFGYSQNSNKKEFLYDENWKTIEMSEFKDKIKDSKYTYKLFENDTVYVGKILLREEIGKITTDDRTQLIKYLRKITNSEVDSTKNIIINFFFKPEFKPNGSCIDNYTSDNKYKRYFKKSANDIQFFVTQKDYAYQKKNVFQDNDDFIRELLFKYYFDCGNYIIIKPNGEFLLRRGEYHQNEIKEKINSQWKKL
ncbi:hypothetical protein [Winogradskyella eximia]|nr:hypothetical protein [Winogradskyella eximia]